MTVAADAQRLQTKKRDQYVSTLKRAFVLAYAKTIPSTAAEWAALYVSIEARVAKSLRDKNDGIGDRAAFQSGYGLFHTHELRNGALEKRHHPKVLDRTTEQQHWEAFCERTSRDARSEAQKQAHKRAVNALRGAAPIAPVQKHPKRSAANASPRSVTASAFPPAVSAHAELASTEAVFAYSYQVALGNGAVGPRMRTWPRFRVQEPPRSLIESTLADGRLVRMNGRAHPFDRIADATPGSAIAFREWVDHHGFLNLSNSDLRQLVHQVRSIAEEARKPVGDFFKSDLRSLACPRGRCSEEHARRLRAGLVPLAFGSFNSVWGLARDVKATPAFVDEDPRTIVFRIPLRDAMRIACSEEQAVDEVCNVLDAAYAGFGVPIHGACLVTRERDEPCHRACAVMTRAEVSCDRRLGNGRVLIGAKPVPPLHPLRTYFESLNRAIWLMSLRRRLHLDTKLANFVDTFRDLDDGTGGIFAIDLDSNTYKRIGSDSAESSAQGWRPVYLYNALLISVQLRMQLRSEEYDELWWKWMREPLQTLLVQLQGGERAYDPEFQSVAAFVRNLKWAGPLPERNLPDQPEFDDQNDLNAWLAEAYAGYYIYGAYSEYLAPGGDCCLKARIQQARDRHKGAAFAEQRARHDVAEWYKTNYRLRFAPMLRFFSDRRCASRAEAPMVVEVLFEFANATWDELVKSFVDVAPTAQMPRRKHWEPLVSEGMLAARAAAVEDDDLPGWRALASAASGVGPQ